MLALACAASTAAASGDTTIVIRVRSLSIATVVNDRPPKGPSAGDRYTLRARLTNVVAQFGRKPGATVGSDSSTLRLTSATRAVIHGVAALPGGTITYSGTGRVGSNDPIPVVGGTGRYVGARGTLTVGDGSSPLNTYRLTLR